MEGLRRFPRGYTAAAAEILRPYTLGDFSGGIQHFWSVPFRVFQQVLAALPARCREDSHNYAPALGDILEMGNERWSVSGFIVEPERADERISVDGIDVTVRSLQEVAEVLWLVSDADERNLYPAEPEGAEGWALHVWYD